MRFKMKIYTFKTTTKRKLLTMKSGRRGSCALEREGKGNKGRLAINIAAYIIQSMAIMCGTHYFGRVMEVHKTFEKLGYDVVKLQEVKCSGEDMFVQQMCTVPYSGECDDEESKHAREKLHRS